MASWFNLLRTAGLASSGWERFTVAHTALQTAGLTNDIELDTLDAKEILTGAYIKHTTAFAGTGITAYTLSIGITSDLDKYMPAFDVFQATGDTVFNAESLMDSEDFASTTSIRLAATSVGANLDQSSAGAVEVYLLRSVLP